MTAPIVCPRCASATVALIGRGNEALTCGQCGGTWAVSPDNPLFLEPIDGGHTFSKGECPVCHRSSLVRGTATGA